MGFFTSFPLATYPAGGVPALPGTPAFSMDAALTLAWAAQATYEAPDGDKIAAIMQRWNWRLLCMFDRTNKGSWPYAGAKGFVAQTGNATVVAFAGTEPDSPRDLMQDFKFRTDGTGAHKGFTDGAQSALADIAAALSVGEPGPIYLTGHSLGAAMAVLAARALRADDAVAERIAGVYTIGMPRAGNAQFAADYDSELGARTFRLVHGSDLVTKVPPFLMDYRHVGMVLACKRGGSFRGVPVKTADGPLSAAELLEITAATAWDPLIGNSAPPSPVEKPAAVAVIKHVPDPLRDHFPDGYLRGLGVAI